MWFDTKVFFICRGFPSSKGITHFFLSKSEQNKSSKVAVATILNKEANLLILSTNCFNTPRTSLSPTKNWGEDIGEHRYRGT